MDVIFWTGIPAVNLAYRGIGPYQLAWWLRSKSYDCQVIDFLHWMNPETILELTEKFVTDKTLCLGLSTTFWSEWREGAKRYAWSPSPPANIRKALMMFKEKYPHIKIAVGGALTDIIPENERSWYDVMIVAEAEDTFYEVLEEWRKGRKQIFATEYRSNVPYLTGPKNHTFNIEESAHRFIEQDCIVEGETLPIEISRGCIFKCRFCQYPHIGKTKYDYLRRFELIKDEIEHNYKTFKSSNYYILDDTFNDSDFKMEGWRDIITSLDFKINYTAYVRADLLKRRYHHVDILRDTGMMSAFFGVESFHPIASKTSGKGWSGKEGKDFLVELKNYWKNDVTQHLSLIVGIPPETEKDYIDTHTWLRENRFDSWAWNRLSIIPKDRWFTSEFDRDPEAFGFTFDEDGAWKTDYMTQDQADLLTAKLNRDVSFRIKYTSWQALSLLQYGIPREHLTTRHMHSFAHLLTPGKNKFIETYKEKLRNISV